MTFITKTIFTLSIVLGIYCGASAQRVTLEDVTSRSFSGVKSINGQYYYTLYFGEKTQNKGMANFVLSLYDADLNPVKTTQIELSKDSRLSASAFSGKYFLLMFSDLVHNTRTTITMDKEGNVIKKNEEEKLRAALLTIENTPDIHALTEDEFLVVRPEKDKKFGYSILRMDKDQNVKWTKSFFPEKGSWEIEDSRIVNGKLYILRKGKEAFIGDKYTYAVQGITLDNGENLYVTELKDEEDGSFPNFISVKEDGTVATGGMYFKNGKYDEKNSDGLFFAIIGADGKLNKMSKTSWKKVKDQIRGDFSTALVGGKTKVLIEDVIQKKDGSYLVISETWRKSAADETGAGAISKFGGLGGGTSSTNPSDKGFTVMDFALFSFDANGELTAIDKVEKTTKEAVIKGSLADESGLALAQELYKRKFFCYRSIIEINGNQYIMYKNEDGVKTKVYFLPVDTTSVNGIANIDMDKWLGDGLNKVTKISKWAGSGNKTVFENAQFANEDNNLELYKNAIPAKPGHVLIYQFANSKMDIWLEPIPVN